MKKIGLFLGVLVALLTVSCSNILVSGKDGGSVSLVIDGATAQSIRSAGTLRSTTGGSTYTLTASIRGDYTATQSVSSSTDGLGAVTFTFERVPVGKSIILDLTATANGSYIWYGNSGHHTVTRGENQLRIAVGRVSGVLLWKRTDDGSLGVSIVPYGNYGRTTNIETSQDTPVWCFDNDGNMYFQGASDILKCDPQAFSSISIGNRGDASAFFAYDNATDVLYGLRETSTMDYLNTETNNFEWKAELNSGVSNVMSYLGFSANNNIAYVAAKIDEGENGSPVISVKSFNLNADPSSIADTAKSGSPFTLPSLFGNNAPITSQMIYQDGALYLLLGSCYIKDSTAGYSVGAVVKINAGNLAVESSFGQEGYLGLLTSSRTIHGKKCYAPTEANENDYFYGPMGFVAIMPKKLVIADAGFAMSAASTGSNVSLSKKRRIVTVDLETEALSSVTVENYYEPSYSTGCGFQVID